MKYYEIRVTDTSDSNDVATTEYISQDETHTADSVMERVEQAINYQGELGFYNGTQYVVIFPCSDDEGYMYDVYNSKESYEEGEDSEDGGQCTGTLSDAVAMAIN